MADSTVSPVDDQVVITVKGQSDAKYNVTISTAATVRDLKEMLSSETHANLPADRQRLIYSGRVLKDNDTIASTNIKSGHTVHLVRSAESNTRQNPASGSQSAAIPAVPTNIAAGTGNSPLAGLTGARYAGFHGLPNMSAFGPDGGMAPPMSADQMERMLENPMFVSQLTEFMNSPQAMQLMEPIFSQHPQLREMMRNPEIRRMLFSPESIRTQLQISRAMGRDPMNPGGSFPAPGVTDNTATTPQSPPAGAGTEHPSGTTAPQPPNPFAALFPGAGAASTPSHNDAANIMRLHQLLSGQRDPGSPFSGDGSAAPRPTQIPSDQRDALLRLIQALETPETLEALGRPAPGLLFGGPPQPPAPADTRPPEERYETQLRQLNEMGFYNFERNMEALRRSGGNVQGALDHLLNQF